MAGEKQAAMQTIDPWAAIFGTGLGAALQPSSSSAMGGNQGGSTIDNSGFNVAFGNSKLNADQSEQTALNGTFKYVLVGAAFLIAIKWLKIKKN